jgi:anti-sigma factor RsiW
VAALLQHYLDGRLDPATAQRAHDHLERCRDCGLEADAYEALKAALHEYGAPPADSIDRLAEFARRLAEGDVPEPSG